MRRFFKFISLTAVLAFVSIPLFAQRMTPGRPSVEAQVLFGESMNYKGVGVNGFQATWNNHQYIGHTTLGVDFYTHPYGYLEEAIYDDDGNLLAPEVDHTFRAYDITAGGGYMFRLLSSRSRSVILSAGGGIYPGVRYCKEIGDFVNTAKSSNANVVRYSPVGFLLNLVPEVQLEVFPFSNVSLYLSARPRLQLVSGLAGHYDWFRFSWGFGVKVYL